MNNKKYWIAEAIRHLSLALIGAHGKVKEHINKALECLGKYQEENKNG